MDDVKLPFQKVLDTLLDGGREIPRRHLQEFSDIEPEALASLLETWPRIQLNRKLFLLDRLIALIESDTLVSFDELGRSLLTDDSAAVRIRAIRLLAECDDARLVPAYIRILTEDDDVYARAEAASALGRFVQLGEFEDISADLHHEIEDELMGVVNSGEENVVQRRALESLGYSSRPEASTLIKSSFERQDPDWKASALFAMGRSADERWQEQILPMFLAVNNRVRTAAVQAAGELGLPSARLLLLKLLEEEDDDIVAGAAIWSLSQIGGEDVRTYLENLLDLAEEDEQIAFLEEALDNLAFTEDMARFDLLAYDTDDEMDEFDELDVEE